ncbi:MAG: hypothetical protein ABS911_12360 [Carnobacterium sp.]|uniref:hypothetical protein n=1 Tax=Carnobacterium sp. TaxID=48221 RepID=UPI003314A6C7
MDNIFIITSIVVGILLIIFFVFLLLQKKNASDIENGDNSPEESNIELMAQSLNKPETVDTPIIPVEKLPSNVKVKENLLHEITNTNIISSLSSLSPAIVNALGKTQTVNTTTTTKLTGDFYQVILKSGGELAKSKNMENARRAFTQGSKGVKEHANLVKIDPKATKEVTKTTKMATSVTANIMNVASLIVGQYYMSEVNSKLEDMNKSISEISDYQKREFKSHVRSLVVNVRDISKFSKEIFEDDTIRNNKLIHLQQLQERTTQLLEQVNLEIEEKIQKQSHTNYDEYLTNVNDFESLIFFQNTLLGVLQKIGKLTLIFGNGKLSQESSFSLFYTYEEQSLKTDDKLIVWQNNQIEKYAIDVDTSKRKKQGIEGVFANVTGLIKDEWRYLKLEEELIDKVKHQMTLAKIEYDTEELNLYQEDIQLLIRDGKTYLWLPEK